MTDALTAALAYAERGWRIFPVPPEPRNPTNRPETTTAAAGA
jgi:hypothetical protein